MGHPPQNLPVLFLKLQNMHPAPFLKDLSRHDAQNDSFSFLHPAHFLGANRSKIKFSFVWISCALPLNIVIQLEQA